MRTRSELTFPSGNAPVTSRLRSEAASSASLSVLVGPTYPMLTPSYNKAVWTAIGDGFLRALFSVTILAVGYWAPSSYMNGRYPILSQFGPGGLGEAAFSLAKAAAFIYGIMAAWSFRRALVALWWPHEKQEPT